MLVMFTGIASYCSYQTEIKKKYDHFAQIKECNNSFEAT